MWQELHTETQLKWISSCRSRHSLLQRRLPVCATLYYGAPYELRNDKKETLSVEGVNAELPHLPSRAGLDTLLFFQTVLKSAIGYT